MEAWQCRESDPESMSLKSSLDVTVQGGYGSRQSWSKAILVKGEKKRFGYAPDGASTPRSLKRAYLDIGLASAGLSLDASFGAALAALAALSAAAFSRAAFSLADFIPVTSMRIS